jgi:hypothetical protein
MMRPLTMDPCVAYKATSRRSARTLVPTASIRRSTTIPQALSRSQNPLPNSHLPPAVSRLPLLPPPDAKLAALHLHRTSFTSAV